MTTQRRPLRHPDGGEATTPTPLGRQHALPRTIPLIRHIPRRADFSWRGWDPMRVRCAADLPPYLILGNLDASTFERSDSGWSARWQGTEDDTHLDVTCKTAEKRWVVRQRWCGLDGGFSFYSTRIPLDKVIGQTLYLPFPRDWDSAAKTQLESRYQITVVEQPEKAAAFCGIPDGAFRTIVFPLGIHNLRPVRQWIQDVADETPLTYPIAIEARLVFQAINYVEGKAPAWTAQEAVAFNHSVKETGLVPLGFPVREVANDGSVAWTLRREIYFLFITLPFAALTDFLNRMATEQGPIRTTSAPDLRLELRPVVIPAGLEIQAEHLALWDQGRTTRSTLQFRHPGQAKVAPSVKQAFDDERNVSATLAKVEAISGAVMAEIERIFQRVMEGEG